MSEQQTDQQNALDQLSINALRFLAVDAVEKAAQDLVKERFLLKVDADADISAAQASAMLN